jgi:hypothetical protein
MTGVRVCCAAGGAITLGGRSNMRPVHSSILIVRLFYNGTIADVAPADQVSISYRTNHGSNSSFGTPQNRQSVFADTTLFVLLQ